QTDISWCVMVCSQPAALVNINTTLANPVTLATEVNIRNHFHYFFLLQVGAPLTFMFHLITTARTRGGFRRDHSFGRVGFPCCGDSSSAARPVCCLPAEG